MRRGRPGAKLLAVAGCLIIVCGLPGSGKTTLACELEADLGAVRLCADDEMLERGLDLWDADERQRIENDQRKRVPSLLDEGRTVVVEWGSWSRAERDELRRLARTSGAAVELRFLDAPLDVLLARLDDRGREAASGAAPIRSTDLAEWDRLIERPTAEELAMFDHPESNA